MERSDLKSMNTEELRDLHKIVVAELNERTRLKSAEAARKFRVGDYVKFFHRGRVVFGQVLSVNQKSISVMAADDQRWRVSPSLLSLEPRVVGQK